MKDHSVISPSCQIASMKSLYQCLAENGEKDRTETTIVLQRSTWLETDKVPSVAILIGIILSFILASHLFKLVQ